MKKIKVKYGEKIKAVFGEEVKLPETKIPRLKISEIFEIFGKYYGLKVPKHEQMDLTPDQEKLICDYSAKYLGSEAVFVTDYPAEARAFYSKRIEGTYDCMAFDFLYRGWEMNSGAVREHRYDQLKAQIKDIESVAVDACKRTITCVKCAKNDKSCHCKNNEGIDEHTDHSGSALSVRILNVCKSVSVGSRTHTCFVGEETSLCALADCGLKRCTD